MFGWLRDRLRPAAVKARQGLMLVSNWLAGQNWLLDNTWKSLIANSYGRNAVAYSALRMLAQAVPEARLTAYTGEDDDKQELPKTHPLRQLLRRPNDLMTEFEMLELLTIHLGGAGRSVWYKEKANNGTPLALWPLRPDRVGPVYATEGVIAGYSYQDPGTGQYIFLPKADCIAVNFPDPDGESGGIVEGFGPLSACRLDVSADNKATEHVGALLANYAQPGIALKLQDSVDADTAALIKAKFRQEFGGSRLGTPAILDAGADITVLGFSLKDLDFTGVRGDAESRICASLGVPAGLVGVKVGLDASTYNNREADRRFFTETTLAFYWRRYSDVFTRDLAADFGEDITVEFDTRMVKALADQFAEQMAPWHAAFIGGAITVNQYIGQLHLEPLLPEVGDVLYVPKGVTVTPTTPEAKAVLDERAAEAQEQALELAEAQKPEQAEQPEDDTDQGAGGSRAQAQAIPRERSLPRPSAKALYPAQTVTVIPIDDELAAALGLTA
jgi:HK97 family phage portal protein